MFKNIDKNILPSEIKYMNIALLAEKIKVLIIGGGRAGFTKCKTFSKRGCNVCVIAESFIAEFNEFEKCENVRLINRNYKVEDIYDKHIVIIAVEKREVNLSIIRDCEKSFKLYLNCMDFKEGQLVVPSQRETDAVCFTVNTKSGNPRASVFLADIIENTIHEYDDFIEYTKTLREKSKEKPFKYEIMDFVLSKDFYFFYNIGVNEKVLNLFFGGDILEP